MMMLGCEFSSSSPLAPSHHHANPNPNPNPKPFPRWKPDHVDPAPPCPRCSSPNTKFCYYNNYSLSQPRYLCKSCRRYWTKGGFLRNVPVPGGGTSRKSRRTNTNKALRRPSTNHVTGSSGEGQEGNYINDTSRVEGCDIDMAVVFANYLSSPHDDVAQAQPSDPAGGDGILLPPQEEMSGGIELEWESLLGGGEGEGEGEVGVEDVFSLLSDDATTSSSSSVMWQPPPLMQLQQEDLDVHPLLPFNYDDDDDGVSHHLPIADSSWNWSSFDFPTFPAFSSSSSRPLDS